MLPVKINQYKHMFQFCRCFVLTNILADT